MARWKTDEKSGQYAQDTSGNANTGTLGTGTTADASDPVWKSASWCHSGSCLSFDGADDYVSIANESNFRFENTTFTASAWVKTTTTIFSEIMAKGGANEGWLLEVNTVPGKFTVRIKNTDSSSVARYSVASINDGKWHYCVAVITTNTTDYTLENINLYIDGVLSNSGLSGNVPYTAGTFNVEIGRRAIGNYFSGLIDDVRIYNYARSAAQIAWDYNRGAPIAWWKMNDGQNSSTTCDGTGTVVKDSSGDNNTGTLTLGATQPQPMPGARANTPVASPLTARMIMSERSVAPSAWLLAL